MLTYLPLYVKAYEIVSTRNMKIFVRLGGFHQLMSFLGSIGCPMESSGLRTALGYVYAQLTVGHMFSGKAYACAVRGNMLCSSAVLSLLLEHFLASLTESQHAKLIEIYKLNNPDDHINDDVAIKLIDLFKMKKEELSSQCRTAAFWLKFT